MNDGIAADRKPDEKPARYGRIHRLLEILMLIQSGRARTAADLARATGVAERTIYRDLKEIEGAGISIPFNAQSGGYEIGGDRFMAPVQLTPAEALSITVLCEQIARHEQIPFTSAAWRGLAKLTAGMPASLRDEVCSVANAVRIKTAQAIQPDGFEGVYERVQEAIAEKRSLVCRYDSLNPGTDDGEEFDFDPYALFFSVRAWYTVGLHHGRGAVRTLKLNRFSSIRLTRRAYTVPDDFSMDDHLGNAWRMMRGSPDHAVLIRFDPEFAETIADTLWHRTQTIEEESGGSVLFRCTVSGLDEIAWWVLSMGPHCEVLEPPELRDRVRDAAAATAHRYNGSL